MGVKFRFTIAARFVAVAGEQIAQGKGEVPRQVFDDQRDRIDVLRGSLEESSVIEFTIAQIPQGFCAGGIRRSRLREMLHG